MGDALLQFPRASEEAFFGSRAELTCEDDAGNRSSVDESSNGNGPEDETTVVEPDQGNGIASNTSEAFTPKLMTFL